MQQLNKFVAEFVEILSEKSSQIVMILVVIWMLLRIIRVTLKEVTPVRWRQGVENFNYSPEEFYDKLKDKIIECKIPQLRSVKKVVLRIGGIFSGWRYYLCVSYDTYRIYICASPFGTGYFFSHVIVYRTSLLRAILYRIPIIGTEVYRKHISKKFYQEDTEHMFVAVVHTQVVNLIDEILEKHNLPKLDEVDRKLHYTNVFRR